MWLRLCSNFAVTRTCVHIPLNLNFGKHQQTRHMVLEKEYLPVNGLHCWTASSWQPTIWFCALVLGIGIQSLIGCCFHLLFFGLLVWHPMSYVTNVSFLFIVFALRYQCLQWLSTASNFQSLVAREVRFTLKNKAGCGGSEIVKLPTPKGLF